MSDSVRKAIDKLIAEAQEIRTSFERDDDQKSALYQPWFTRCRRVVAQIVPERLDEFEKLYPGNPPKGQASKTWVDYGIDEYLRGVQWRNLGDRSQHASHAISRLGMQFNIVRAAQAVLDDQLANIRGTLQAQLFDSELDAARHLADAGHIRAAGVVAGVVLEGHLKQVCESHQISMRHKSPTLSDFNDALKEAGLLDVPRWRNNQYLGDLRNLCSHKKEREPTTADIAALVEGVNAAIKTIG